MMHWVAHFEGKRSPTHTRAATFARTATGRQVGGPAITHALPLSRPSRWGARIAGTDGGTSHQTCGASCQRARQTGPRAARSGAGTARRAGGRVTWRNNHVPGHHLAYNIDIRTPSSTVNPQVICIRRLPRMPSDLLGEARRPLSGAHEFDQVMSPGAHDRLELCSLFDPSGSSTCSPYRTISSSPARCSLCFSYDLRRRVPHQTRAGLSPLVIVVHDADTGVLL